MDAFFLCYSKLLYLLVDWPLFQPSDHKKNKHKLKLAGTLAGVIAFIIGLTVLVLVTSAYREKIGKAGEKVMISKCQIFFI